MELNHKFRVALPEREAWDVLTDVQRIAPLMPGAQLLSVEGDNFKVSVKVKVGPITAQYQGVAIMTEADEAAGRIVIDAKGRDTRGQGNASALVSVGMTGAGESTDVSVHTDLNISGKVAQLGRGVVAEVSSKLLDQFVKNLENHLAEAADPSSLREPEVANDGTPLSNPVGQTGNADVEALDLWSAARWSMIKRASPGIAFLVVGLAALIVRGWRRS